MQFVLGRPPFFASSTGLCTYVTSLHTSKSYIFDSKSPLALLVVLFSLPQNLFELLLTWFKKYHLLFPNYASAFISSFNCLYQRDHNVVPAVETLRSKCVKTCQILPKHPETVRVLLQTPWHLLKA